MLQFDSNKRKAFEAAVYNKEVRAAVKDNKSHVFFDDHWADLQIQDVIASAETESHASDPPALPAGAGFRRPGTGS